MPGVGITGRLLYPLHQSPPTACWRENRKEVVCPLLPFTVKPEPLQYTM